MLGPDSKSWKPLVPWRNGKLPAGDMPYFVDLHIASDAQVHFTAPVG